MTSTIARHAVVRHLLLVGIVALVAMLAVSVTAPEHAHAIRNPNVVLTGQQGWVKTRPVMTCMAMTPECMNAGHTAYRWTGRSWVAVTLRGGIDVYVYPYQSPWHWIWTQRTGWLAIQNSALETGYHCTGIDCPVF